MIISMGQEAQLSEKVISSSNAMFRSWSTLWTKENSMFFQLLMAAMSPTVFSNVGDSKVGFFRKSESYKE